MYFKYFVVISAALAAASCTTTNSGKPNVSISCFEDNVCKNKIGIVNNTKKTVTNLNVFCPAKNSRVAPYQLDSSFDLDAKQSRCLNLNDINTNCNVSSGFFTGHNVELKVTSDDYDKWKKTSSCSWD